MFPLLSGQRGKLVLFDFVCLVNVLCHLLLDFTVFALPFRWMDGWIDRYKSWGPAGQVSNTGGVEIPFSTRPHISSAPHVSDTSQGSTCWSPAAWSVMPTAQPGSAAQPSLGLLLPFGSPAHPASPMGLCGQLCSAALMAQEKPGQLSWVEEIPMSFQLGWGKRGKATVCRMHERSAAASVCGSLHGGACLAGLGTCSRHSACSAAWSTNAPKPSHMQPAIAACIPCPGAASKLLWCSLQSLLHLSALQWRTAISFVQGGAEVLTPCTDRIPPCKGAGAAGPTQGQPQPSGHFPGCDPFWLPLGTCVQSGWKPINLPLLDSSSPGICFSSEQAYQLARKCHKSVQEKWPCWDQPRCNISIHEPHKLIMLLTSWGIWLQQISSSS